ncbi:CcmD family protein [bacterium]|nr:CcmD family protein [bacterium]
MQSYTFLFWAYNIVWASIAGYMLLMFLRVRKLDRRLDALERERPGGDD